MQLLGGPAGEWIFWMVHLEVSGCFAKTQPPSKVRSLENLRSPIKKWEETVHNTSFIMLTYISGATCRMIEGFKVHNQLRAGHSEFLEWSWHDGLKMARENGQQIWLLQPEHQCTLCSALGRLQTALPCLTVFNSTLVWCLFLVFKTIMKHVGFRLWS